MTTTNLTPSAIVTERLNGSNYNNWKVWMKSYLLGQDLWDIVDGSEAKPEANHDEFRTWRRNNAKAVHAIQTSCEPLMFSIIREMDSAKATWDHLADIFKQANEEKKSPSEIGSSSINQQTLGWTECTWHLPLYKAVNQGDWETAARIIKQYPEALRTSVKETGETALHVATASKQVQLVKELVKLMPVDALEIKNESGVTALSLAVEGGIKEIIEVMVKKNVNLLCIQNQHSLIPVVMATIKGKRDVLHYLYSMTPMEELSPQRSKNGASLLTVAIHSDIYDVALDLLQRFPSLATAPDINGNTALNVLSGKPSAFPSGSKHGIWQRWIYACIDVDRTNAIGYIKGDRDNPHKGSTYQVHMITQVIHRLYGLARSALTLLVPGIKQIHDRKLTHVQTLELLKIMSSQIILLDVQQLTEARVYTTIFRAIEWGIVEFIENIIKYIPNVISIYDGDQRGLLQATVFYRHEKIFNLIRGIMGQNDDILALIDKYGNSILDLAGLLAPYSQLNKVSGAALQMQRELQWYKELEKIVHPRFQQQLNVQGLTPRALFTKEHKDLIKEGEKWMKETAQACMVVSTLIATVMFAAVFTVPGGNNGDKGIPIFIKDRAFMVFIVADALSLFSSCTSLLMFLAILTSRYAEEDFLKSLPQKLIIGLFTLFFSIATMMVAFGATLVIVLHERVRWVTIPVTLLGSIPVTLFALLQFPLFVDMVLSTYGSGIFPQQTKGKHSNSWSLNFMRKKEIKETLLSV